MCRQWLRMIQTSDTCEKRVASRLHQNQPKVALTVPHHFPIRPTSRQILPLLRENLHKIPTKIKHLMFWPSRPSLATPLQLILLPKTPHLVMTKICRTHSSLPYRVRKGCHNQPSVVPVGEMEMVDGGTSRWEYSVRNLSCSS